MTPSNTKNNAWETANAQNTRGLAYWTGAWLVSIAMATFGPRLLWEFNVLFTILAVAASLLMGAGMILATVRHLKGIDEMHQKIFLEASALTLGIGLVCGSSYELLEDVRLIAFEPQISHLILLMGLTFLASIIVGTRRYR